MDSFRIEKDSLGEVRVPTDALYGAQTQRAVMNFNITGRKPYRMFIWSVAVIKWAAADVNGQLGLLPKKKAVAIARAAREVAEGKWDSEFVVDPIQAGAGTSHNMNANEVIANRATQLMGGRLGEYRVRPNDDVNMSQSTNDVIPTAIRLGLVHERHMLDAALSELARTFQKKARQFDGVIKSGRTHLQDAVPIRLGQEFAAYGKTVDEDRLRIATLSNQLLYIGIGGTATGSSLNAHPFFHRKMISRLAVLTKEKYRSSGNLFESMQSLSDVASFSAGLRSLALTLTRIANDLRLMASGPSSGLDEIRFPPLQPGSSIMPGKINPVMAEMLNMSMYHVIGLDTAVALASQAGQFELNVMMPIIAQELFEMMHVLAASIRSFNEKGLSGLSANPERAAAGLEKNAILATALNPLIGYMAAAELVKEAVASDRSIRELALEKARAASLLHKDQRRPVTPEEIRQALGNLRKMTDGGLM
jgi:fumarate hydratase, class II